jgi:hypothetical protein
MVRRKPRTRIVGVPVEFVRGADPSCPGPAGWVTAGRWRPFTSDGSFKLDSFVKMAEVTVLNVLFGRGAAGKGHGMACKIQVEFPGWFE